MKVCVAPFSTVAFKVDRPTQLTYILDSYLLYIYVQYTNTKDNVGNIATMAFECTARLEAVL